MRQPKRRRAIIRIQYITRRLRRRSEQATLNDFDGSRRKPSSRSLTADAIARVLLNSSRWAKRDRDAERTDLDSQDSTEIEADSISWVIQLRIVRKSKISVRDELPIEKHKALASSLDELDAAVKEAEAADHEITGFHPGVQYRAPDDEQFESLALRLRKIDRWLRSLIEKKSFTPDLAKRLKSIAGRVFELQDSLCRIGEAG